MELTLDELITLMEPQAQKDKELIIQCIDGLTEYASELRQRTGDVGRAKSAGLRDLIAEMEGYWGLNCSGEDHLVAFDHRMQAAEQSKRLRTPTKEQISSAVLGLYRYAMDMIPNQGADEAAELVRECEQLMRDIAAFWNCATSSLDDLCLQIQDALQNQREWENTASMGGIE